MPPSAIVDCARAHVIWWQKKRRAESSDDSDAGDETVPTQDLSEEDPYELALRGHFPLLEDVHGVEVNPLPCFGMVFDAVSTEQAASELKAKAHTNVSSVKVPPKTVAQLPLNSFFIVGNPKYERGGVLAVLILTNRVQEKDDMESTLP